MSLSWNEIKDRALKFSKEWEGESRERAEKDSFWNDFFDIFGISRRRLATFEEPVKKLNNKQGFIDLFWKGTLLVEHKSKGKNLDAAFEQATDYFYGLKEAELPKYILVSDFERFKLYDLDEKEEFKFNLSDLHTNIKLFGFIAGYQKRSFKDEDPVNIKAAELMGKLYDQLKASGYEGHQLEVFLVRLLFCLFADDTSIFEKDTFLEFIEVKTHEDGSNLGALLAQFFQVLNTPHDKRMKSLDEHLNAFPYVNGKLYEEPLPIAAFDSTMREILIQCSALDWGKISPAIFGSMFQSVMNPQERRDLGAHYTSEKNILKLIKPLFLDDLYAEFEKTKVNKRKLSEFHHKLGSLKFLDPACGCGNFLIITYRELRLLELEILKVLYGKQQVTGIEHILHIDVDQFYGIEYDEFPAKIAEVALWLMDHQMNMRISEEFGLYYARLPLKKSATIVHGNALTTDWQEVVPKDELSYILGNPPFLGGKYQSQEQKNDLKLVFEGVKGAGVLDYVACWYVLAAQYVQDTSIRVAFVSTNSITQGEQVGILWGELFEQYHMKIHFAHRTFSWKNEAKGNAAVHVVIIGFAAFDTKQKVIFEYESIKGEPHVLKVKNISPYLFEGNSFAVVNRSRPLCDASQLKTGNKPIDDGNFIFTELEKDEFLKSEPLAVNYIKPFIGGYEFINGNPRYILWLRDIEPSVLKKMPMVMGIIQRVKVYRESSHSKPTQKLALTPTRFHTENYPDNDFLIIPEVSSERRAYIPIGFEKSGVVCSNKLRILNPATQFDFGVLVSTMHMSWMRVVTGRLKSDYQYSIGLVYNNYPWPKDSSDKNIKAVEAKAQHVLDVRAEFPESSLADLYDPLTMPPKLVKAHQALDKAVDLCYRPQAFANERVRIEYLFDLYQQYTAPLLPTDKKNKRKKAKAGELE